MLKKINREKLPTRMKIYDSSWHRGIMIGNTIIFTAPRKKETKKIETIYQEENYIHGFYIKYKNERVLKIIYTRE